MRFIRIIFIWRTYNESSFLTLEYIHQNPIKNRKFLLLYSHKNNKIKKSKSFKKTWLPIHSSVKRNFKKTLLKLEMWPVNKGVFKGGGGSNPPPPKFLDFF